MSIRVVLLGLGCALELEPPSLGRSEKPQTVKEMNDLVKERNLDPKNIHHTHTQTRKAAWKFEKKQKSPEKQTQILTQNWKRQTQ